MIADMILDFAENLGRKLAKRATQQFSGSTAAPANIDDTNPVPAKQIMESPQQTVVKPVLAGDKAVYRIKPFKDNENGTAYWQSFLKSFMDLTQSVEYVITWNRSSITMYAIMPTSVAIYFENVFYANYSTSELIREDYKPLGSQYRISYGEKDILTVDRDFMKEWKYLDPLKDLFGVFDNVDASQKLSYSFTYTFKSEKDFWDVFFERVSSVLQKIFSKKEEVKAPEKEEKPEDAIKVGIAIGVWFQSNNAAQADWMKLTAKAIFSKFLHKGGVIITPEKAKTKMTLSQVANFFHIPTKDYFVNTLDYAVYRKLSYPPSLPLPEVVEKNALTLLGKTDYRGQELRFGIKDEDSFRHLYIVWKTGTGKSTFLSNIIKSHMYTNKWLCLIDPHGDLVDTVMEHVPSRRTNDVILFDVWDTSNPIWFNLLQYNTEDEKNLIVSGVVATFKKLFGQSWGPRLEYVLRNVMLSVVEYPNATIMHIMRVLTDKNFREEVLENVKDPIVLKFWRGEFDKWSDTQRNEAIAPITNKVGQFLSSPVVRNVFGQPSSKLNMRKVMDEWKILLVNLSKGKIGEDNTEMIWSFIVTKLQIDAMSRTDIPERDRRPFYLHIDEFQNFATDSFAVILSEARKYRLALIVANQYTSQLNETIRDAIFGNVGSMVSFNIWYDDAVQMAQQFKWILTPNDLISIPKFRAYIRLMIDGIMSDPFSMGTLPLWQPEASAEIKDKIRTQSRQRYSMEREKLEELIKIWSNKSFSPVEKAMEKAMKMDAEAAPVVPASTPAPPPAPKPAAPVQQVVSQPKPASVAPATPQQAVPWSIEARITPIVNDVWIPISTKTTFTINDVVIGDQYDGIVKLKYNYGLFVTVRGVEWLLHKNMIKVPEWISWKDVYNIGDKIRVRATEYKEINGEKKIVWGQ